MNQRIGKYAAGADVDQAPLGFAGHRIGETPPQESQILGLFECIEILREAIVFAHVQLNGA